MLLHQVPEMAGVRFGVEHHTAFGLIPCLGVAAAYARKLYARTNTILFTMITLANTAAFWNLT
ncbi:MAG: hypothetical protein FWB78_06850 [Treponema sp.]|nr:hypothetical protein [Treponema sp.]